MCKDIGERLIHDIVEEADRLGIDFGEFIFDPKEYLNFLTLEDMEDILRREVIDCRISEDGKLIIGWYSPL